MVETRAGIVEAGAPPVRGLTRAEAAARLAAEGLNELPAPRPVPAWRRLATQMFHFFALLFWVAGGLAFVAGMPNSVSLSSWWWSSTACSRSCRRNAPSTPPSGSATCCPGA